MVTRMTSRSFNQDTAAAKRAAERGPVLITDRGRPSHVLLTISEFERMTSREMSLLEALAPSEAQDFAFEPPRLDDLSLRVPELD